ncbi:MAG: hypothetical protein R6U46_01930 [Marinilabilia sp.]
MATPIIMPRQGQFVETCILTSVYECPGNAIGGLDAVVDTTLNLPDIPGGKKLIYNHISMPLTAIADFEEKGENDPFFAELSHICNRNGGLWSTEAEAFLLEHAPDKT